MSFEINVGLRNTNRWVQFTRLWRITYRAMIDYNCKYVGNNIIPSILTLSKWGWILIELFIYLLLFNERQMPSYEYTLNIFAPTTTGVWRYKVSCNNKIIPCTMNSYELNIIWPKEDSGETLANLKKISGIGGKEAGFGGPM